MTDQNDDKPVISKCPHCEAKMVVYIYPMAPILVTALIKFRNAVIRKGENSVHLKNDMDDTPNELGRSERSNWTKIRFHGLVAKVKQENGRQKRGHWLLTKRGNQFIKGDLHIPLEVKVYRNKVIAHSEIVVDIHEVMQSRPWVHTIDDIKFEVYDGDDLAYNFDEKGQGKLL